VKDYKDRSAFNKENFDQFRFNDYEILKTPMKVGVTPERSSQGTRLNFGTPGTPLTPNTQGSTRSAAYEFKKSIKRDKTHYKEFKDEKQWNDWKRGMTSTAYAHGCEDVLNHTYKPSASDEVELFDAKKNFMYDVFLSVMKTPMSKYYVRLYEGTRDAQKVWKDLYDYMRCSTKSDLHINDLLHKITTNKLELDTYKGTTTEYIADFLEVMRQYEDLKPLNEHFKPQVKKTFLQNQVSGVKFFEDIKRTEELEIARGNDPFTYEVYLSLMQRHALLLDKKLSASKLIKKNPRQVQNHNLIVDEDQDDSSNETTLEVNKSKFKSGDGPKLPKDVWDSLSKDDQTNWDKFGWKAKCSILSAWTKKDTQMANA